MNILWLLLIGLCAGWLAGKVVKGNAFGLLGNLIVGVIGALIGGFFLANWAQGKRISKSFGRKDLHC